MRFMQCIAVTVFGLVGFGCSSVTEAIDSDQECVDSFLTAVETNPELRLPSDGEEAAGAFQSAGDWNGETPVCWVNFRLGGSCESFMYDIEGRWTEAEWLPGDIDSSAGCTHDPALPGTLFSVV